jgi:hypothetical protein
MRRRIFSSLARIMRSVTIDLFIEIQRAVSVAFSAVHKRTSTADLEAHLVCVPFRTMRWLAAAKLGLENAAYPQSPKDRIA